jgi:hypothetical protein
MGKVAPRRTGANVKEKFAVSKNCLNRANLETYSFSEEETWRFGCQISAVRTKSVLTADLVILQFSVPNSHQCEFHLPKLHN